jgi:hypothetical protein
MRSQPDEKLEEDGQWEWSDFSWEEEGSLGSREYRRAYRLGGGWQVETLWIIDWFTVAD